MTEGQPIEGTIVRSFPQGTVKTGVDLAWVDQKSISGGQIMDSVDKEIRKHVPDLPPHLVSIAWKIAILRDHITIDPNHLEGVISELLTNDKFVNGLNKPEAISALNTEMGMRHAVDLLMKRFQH